MNATIQEKLKTYRLSESEYKMACDSLGREPQGIEWALFSALWSEHCSYKSSKVHLRKFFSKADHVMEAEGENAGVIDLGQGERVAFKMESHNHPSFIEPYQGAATGVGGILRDIFTMGARPIALANYLCFGEITAPRMTTLLKRVVKGIGDYGNCVGVPTVNGQTEFHERYNENILVNAMAVGLFGAEDKVFLSQAKGVGNYVVYVGAKTGRDGIHGASMASESFDEDSESKRPTIQIGDPFYEKLLIESCLEVMKKDLVVAIQDMGAAGLTSSSFEMASKGRVGMDMHLDQVPLRDSSLTAEDILLSESQERMLLVCKPEDFSELVSEFKKWDLDATKIGEIKEGHNIRLFWHDEMLCDLDPDVFVENAPRYERPFEKWTAKNRSEEWKSASVENDFLPKLLSSELACSRSWVYDQYDQRVGAKTMNDASHSVAVVRLPESGRFLSVATGCRPHVMRFDSWVGGFDAVALPSLQMAALGFRPLAVTDCLNFGNPEKAETMTDFVASVESITEVCRSLNAPVVSGNVSFYNETLGRNITSTPATGIVGLKTERPKGQDQISSVGVSIFSVKLPMLRFAGKLSEWQDEEVLGTGAMDAKKFSAFLDGVLSLADRVEGQRVVGQFGRAYQLFRFLDGVGFECESNCEKRDWLDETLYEVLVATEKEDMLREAFSGFAENEVEIRRLGRTAPADFDLGGGWKWPVAELEQQYGAGFQKILGEQN